MAAMWAAGRHMVCFQIEQCRLGAAMQSSEESGNAVSVRGLIGSVLADFTMVRRKMLRKVSASYPTVGTVRVNDE